MKKVLLSVHPKWCELIFNGKKTIEVRRTRPKLEPPFEVLVYCTKHKLTKTKCMHSYLHKNEPKACGERGVIETWSEIGDVQVNFNLAETYRSYGMHGKVIGSFICDEIYAFFPWGAGIACEDIDGSLIPAAKVCEEACLISGEIYKYFLGNGKETFEGYGWHITEPKLFDKPKELSEFYIPCKWYEKGKGCPEDCALFDYEGAIDDTDDFCLGKRPITRPPQSFCYIEEYPKCLSQ